MSKKFLSRLLVTLIVLVLLTSVSMAKSTTIKFSYWGNYYEDEIWQEVIQAFEADHPNIKVEPLYITERYDEKIQIMMAGGVAPDVMLFEDKRGLPFVPKNVFKNLDEFIENDSDIDLEAFHSLALEDFVFKGKRWGLPWDFITTAVAFNRDAFDEAGVPYPSQTWADPNWNWDTFLQTAKKLTQDKDGDGKIDQFGFLNRYSWSRWRQWVWQNGGLAWSEDGSRAMLDDPRTMEALQFYADLTTKYHVSPTAIEMSDMGGEFEMFSTGRVAMVNIAGYALPQFRQIKTFNWDLGAWPTGRAGAATPFIPDGVTISAKTKHPQEAWELAKFIVGEKAQKLMAAKGYRISPLKSVMSAFVTPDTPQREEVWIDGIEYGRLANYTTRWSEIEYHTIGPEMQLLLAGKKTVREVVDTLTPKINELLQSAETRFAK